MECDLRREPMTKVCLCVRQRRVLPEALLGVRKMSHLKENMIVFVTEDVYHKQVATIPRLSSPHKSICIWRRLVFNTKNFPPFNVIPLRFKTKQTASSVISAPARLLYLYLSSEGARYYSAGMFVRDLLRKSVRAILIS